MTEAKELDPQYPCDPFQRQSQRVALHTIPFSSHKESQKIPVFNFLALFNPSPQTGKRLTSPREATSMNTHLFIS